MIRSAMFVFALAGPVSAEAARVLSGEHGDFTRLVIELPEASDWTVGRTPQGYAFAAVGGDQPAYDLSAVWQRIARSRLQALQVDPDSGALDLRLGCDCHIFPFEYRPGAIVLDIRTGAPPPGSVFEAEFHSTVPKAVPAAGQTGKDGYSWLAETGRPRTAQTAAGLALPLDTGTVSLDPMREALLKGISRGAAEGIVDMALPGASRDDTAAVSGVLPWSRIRFGEQPSLAVSDPDAATAARKPMSECAATGLVDLAAWGGTAPMLDLLVEARSGIYGEFDHADTEAVLRSVRLHLFLGFGAEAGQYVGLLDDPSVAEELALLRSMARIIDAESDPQTPFSVMLDCDGPAALWAALARDRLPAGPGVNRQAILRSFVALPPHLRLHFGTGLAEKFLAIDDPGAARLIRDAVERAPEADMVRVALLDATVLMHNGRIDAAVARAEEVASLEGDSPDALVALVEAHFRKLEPIDPKIAQALLSLQGEMAGTKVGPAVDRAIVLSLALSGQMEAAFERVRAGEGMPADLWRVALDRATDDDFLRLAVLSAGEARPEVAADLALAVGKRLLALGFPDAALVWIGPVAESDAPERRRAAATATFETGDARSVLRLLDGLHDPEAEALRAGALTQLGDLEGSRQALRAAGDLKEAARQGLWLGDWSGLDPATPETWRQAASHAQPADLTGDPGLLARGSTTVDDSQAARTAIEALLSTTPSPLGG